MRRRVFLTATTAVATAGVAGCLGGGNDSTDGNDSGESNDSNGSNANNTNTTGTTPEPAEAAFTLNPETITTSGEVSLNASASTGDIESYEWSFDGRTTSGRTATVSFEEGGEYDVTLTVTTTGGNTAETTRTVSVAGSLDASITVEPSTPAPGETVTIATRNIEGVTEYRWDFESDGTVDSTETLPSVQHSFEEGGTRTVTLEAKRENGSVARQTREVSVRSAAVDEAVTALVENAEQLERLTESGAGTSEEPIQQLRDRVETARDALGRTGETDQTAAVRAVADFQAQLIDDYERSVAYNVSFSQGFEALSVLTPPVSEIQSQPLSDGVSSFEMAASELEEVRSARSEMQTAKGQLPGSLGADALAYSGDLGQYVAYDQSQLDGLERLTRQSRQMMQALRDLFRGRSAFEAGNTQTAADRFSSAEETRQTVSDATPPADSVLETVPTGKTAVEGFLDVAEQLSEVFSLHADAGAAATAGNTSEAQSTFETATARLGQFAQMLEESRSQGGAGSS